MISRTYLDLAQRLCPVVAVAVCLAGCSSAGVATDARGDRDASHWSDSGGDASDLSDGGGDAFDLSDSGGDADGHPGDSAPSDDAGGDSTVGGPGVSLPAGRWTPAKMPMQLIHPRPSLPERSRYRKAHTGFAYEVPVTVQGGAAPFIFALSGAPSGMTIAAQAPTWNTLATTWAMIRWAHPTTGLHTFTIRVTDQEGTTRSVELTVAVDDSAFLFVEPTAADGGDGSLNSPFNGIEDWYTDSQRNDDHSDKIVVYRSGTYAVPSADPALDNNLRFLSNAKPSAHIAFPGETVVWDMSAVWISYSGFNSDTFWDGIHFESSDSSKLNSRVFWFSGGDRRVTMWRLRFAHARVGTLGGSNESCMWFSSSSYGHEFVSLTDIGFDDLPSGSNGFSMFDFYKVKDGTVDGLRAVNLRSRYAAWVKSGSDAVSVRNVDIWDASNNADHLLQIQQGSATPQSKVELLFSRARKSSHTRGAVVLGDSNSDWGTIWVYRVTAAGRVSLDAASAEAYGTAVVESSALFNDNSPTIGAGIATSDNLVGTRAEQSSLIDDQGRILGSRRGEVGFEVLAD